MRAIRALRKNGHLAFINSGRSQAFIIDPMLLGLGWDGFVSGCGTYVQAGERVLTDSLIDNVELARVVRTARDHGVRIVLEGRFCLYFDDDQFAHDPYGQMLIRELGEKRRTIRDHWQNWRCGKFSVDLDTAADGVKWLDLMSDKYCCISHNAKVTELVPYGFGKAAGMREVCSYLGIPGEDSVVFGDSINDLDMFEAAGTAVAMGTASEPVRAAADLVTDGPMDGGIEHALRNLGLI